MDHWVPCGVVYQIKVIILNSTFFKKSLKTPLTGQEYVCVVGSRTCINTISIKSCYILALGMINVIRFSHDDRHYVCFYSLLNKPRLRHMCRDGQTIQRVFILLRVFILHFITSLCGNSV